jgi:hypothetical protein
MLLVCIELNHVHTGEEFAEVWLQFRDISGVADDFEQVVVAH